MKFKYHTSNLFDPGLDSLIKMTSLFSNSKGKIDNKAVVDALEKELCKYHHAKYCITFGSGFWALVFSMKVLSIDDAKNILIPSFTYRRLADAVYWSGKVPKFIDILENSLSVSPESIKNNIDSETALILAVHPIVNCCEVGDIIEISKSHKIPLLFDAVESVHETFGNRRIGSFGIGEVFSFHASKLINGIEGGYVCTNDKNFANTLIQVRDGKNKFGFNNPIQIPHAIFALCSIQEIDKLVLHNKIIYEAYEKYFDKVEGINLLKFDKTEQTSYKNIVIKIESSDYNLQNQIIKSLNKEKIFARPYYYPPLHKKNYEYEVVITDMPITEKLMHSFINMPCGFRMNVKDVKYVCDRLMNNFTKIISRN